MHGRGDAFDNLQAAKNGKCNLEGASSKERETVRQGMPFE